MTKYTLEEKKLIFNIYELHTSIINSVISNISIDLENIDIDELYKITKPKINDIKRLFEVKNRTIRKKINKKKI